MYKANNNSLPMDFSWIGNWSARRAILTPNKEAIYDNMEDKRYNFQEIENRGNKLARVLLDMGLQKGDRVAAFTTNRMEMIDLFFATGKIGAIFVPFNVRLAPAEIEQLTKKMDPKILFYETKLQEKVQTIKDLDLIKNNIVFNDKGFEGDKSYYDLVEKVSDSPVERPEINFEDPHLILFTGGTTGLPKGAVLSHREIFWNSVNTIMSWGLRPDDIQPLLYPLFHTGGWNVLILPFVHLGAKSILMGDFDPVETLKVIEKEKCTIVIGVPTMFHMIANQKEFETANFDSVRIFISGGAPCPVAIMENYWDKGKPFKMGYGLTEVGPNNFYLPEEHIKEKPTSVGLPVFHCEMKLIDPETEKEVAQGEVGELLLKGPHIFSGYWEEPEETEEVIEEDGFVHTGDLAKQDNDGYYYIVGRRKEMYISGGENVFPVEIEEVLYKHPAIDEAAVIGVPDDKWGEVGKAFITLKKGKSTNSDDIRNYLSDKLAKYKIPKYFEIRDSLPMSGTGKILKKELEKEEKA